MRHLYRHLFLATFTVAGFLAALSGGDSPTGQTCIDPLPCLPI